MGFPETAQDADDRAAPAAATTIFVCITCRRPTDPEDFPRPGAALASATARASNDPHVTVRRVRCLANCNRGLSAAIGRDLGWTYVFGDLDEECDAEALVQGARLLAAAGDGLMPWRGRPQPLKRGLIARVPPMDYEEIE